ncbi:MAG: carbon-nitrogen hydrolase family protein [Acidobacteria bacterium]|nr:carbon-nitrogen hydrolase family protein [Acidobacteriota bacterium]
MDLTIAAAQSASIPGNVPRNVSHHFRFAEIAADRGVQLLVFPELSLIGYELDIASSNIVRPESSDFDPLRELAAQADMTVVAGAPVLGDGGRLHIASLIFRPDRTVAVYTKEHVHESEAGVFAPGPGAMPFPVNDASVALAICADATHPQHAAKAATAGANVYAVGVMITADAYARKAGLLQNYAQHHRMAVLMANYSGVTGGCVPAGRSSIWSEDGRLLVASTGAGEELIIGRRRRTRWEGAVVPL